MPVRPRLWLTLVAVTALCALVLPVASGAPRHDRQSLVPLLPESLMPPAMTEPAPPPEPAPAPEAERCRGAAAKDPALACGDSDDAYRVEPDPARARAAQTFATCTRNEVTPLFKACFFGASEAKATRTVALVGDSHAAHWRAALETVIAAKGWRAVSIQRAGCPLTAAHPDLPGVARQRTCMAWNRSVQRWLAARPQIDTVFTSAHLGAVIPRPGEEMRTTQRAGYTSAWVKLLRGAVKQVVVIRGTPRISGRTIACVQQAAAARLQPPGLACALERSYALRPDPAAQAAQRLRLASVQVADLSRFMCDATRCYPVVGGVLVLRDVSHMTTAFSRSMGPYLLRTVNRLSAGWAPAAPRGS